MRILRLIFLITISFTSPGIDFPAETRNLVQYICIHTSPAQPDGYVEGSGTRNLLVHGQGKRALLAAKPTLSWTSVSCDIPWLYCNHKAYFHRINLMSFGLHTNLTPRSTRNIVIYPFPGYSRLDNEPAFPRNCTADCIKRSKVGCVGAGQGHTLR